MNALAKLNTNPFVTAGFQVVNGDSPRHYGVFVTADDAEAYRAEQAAEAKAAGVECKLTVAPWRKAAPRRRHAKVCRGCGYTGDRVVCETCRGFGIR